MSSLGDIPNINIGQAYDQQYLDADIHYDRLENLADFFGRNMPVHYHDRFYQLHVIENGVVRVHLDETSYSAQGPMFFLTPPTVPHAFVLEDHAEGHVVTTRQPIMWEILGTIEQNAWPRGFLNTPLCIEMKAGEDEQVTRRILYLLALMAEEKTNSIGANDSAMKALLQLVLIYISRLSYQAPRRKSFRKEDVRVFHEFNELIETHYREHIKLKRYAGEIGVTEARLNEICRRLSGLPSKRLVIERVMQEARRRLLFTTRSISEIGYELGFRDPAYFARFFRRNAGMTAGQYRSSDR